jgi:alpha-glucoside transport system substrate-binding protein
MKVRKSSVFLSLVLVFILAIWLVGCGDDGEETTTTAGGTETSAGGETTSTAGGPVGSVSIIGIWGGSELEGFQPVADAWQQQSGGQMQFEATRDLSAILRARVSGNNPPDMAILPNPALLQEFAAAGNIKPLNDILDMDAFTQNFGETWVQQGSFEDQVYGLFIRASSKSTVWYSPARFDEAGYEIPGTWEELKSLSDQIVQDGTAAPWTMGVESQAASGWPGSDWIQEIFLHESGPDAYDQWVTHEIPWTDAKVKSAFERFGEIVHTEGYVAGGPQSVINTGPEPASYLPFEDPPRAYMDFIGAFAEGFITAQFKDAKAGEDYDFFPFVAIGDQYGAAGDAVTGSGDVVVVFNDTPGVRSFLQFMADGKNWQSWAERGGFTTPNKSLDTSAYPNEVIAKTAEQLTESKTFRFDADDLMPAEVQQAFWKGILDYIQNPGDLDSILQGIEDVAAGAYQQ